MIFIKNKKYRINDDDQNSILRFVTETRFIYEFEMIYTPLKYRIGETIYLDKTQFQKLINYNKIHVYEYEPLVADTKEFFG